MIPQSYARRLFSALLMSLAPVAAHAYTVSTTSGHEIKWFVRSEAVFINPGSGPVGSSNAIQSAMNTWSTVPGAQFQFTYAGATAISGAVWDGYNVCSFGNLGSGGVIARNTYWSYPDTGQMIESDIVFNTYYTFSVSGEAGKIDLQNTATHELGHALSLADLYGGGDTEKTMYGYISTGETKKRTLDADDIAGLVHLYPAPLNTLTVVSAYGGAYPGTVTTNWGTALVERMTNSPIAVGVSTQIVCTAGVVSGNAYVQVAATNVTLTLTNNATLTWQWQTQYRLAVQTNGSGNVSATNSWFAAGSNAVLTASAGSYWHFTGWSGSTSGCAVAGSVITAPMTQARTVVANFAENLAPLGTPEIWFAQHALTNGTPASEELKDTDGDGMLAWQEYEADTDPTNSASVLIITGVTFDAGTVRVNWKSGQWAKQYLDVRTDLAGTNSPWTCIMTNEALPTLTTNFVLRTGVTNPAAFYRVRVMR